MRIAITSFLLCFLFACHSTPVLPKPKAQLNLHYPEAKYTAIENSCPYQFDINETATFGLLRNCESKIVYPSMQATIYLSYRPIENNLDSLLSDAYQMPSKHIIKASSIPEKVFINPENRAYGTLFRIEGEAASQAQFFLTDSLDHFLVGSLYFYARPNYDSILPAARYVEKDMVKLMESLRWKEVR
ncbi:MAG: gliding motility lipoprotein GldD [Flavobacteriaceae bacterium]|jgi:gliding motility-associated lipoprotein GldD|nr:gliding motility lipoprotein GldD [Flavobacteriaceae bacterium]